MRTNLRKRLSEAVSLKDAVQVLLKWYEGDNVPFHREFVKRLPDLLPSGSSLGFIDGGEADTIFTQQFPDLDGGNA